MFSIGLEFSLPQLRAMRRAVFGLGLAQVAITTRRRRWSRCTSLGYGWQAGLVLGGALAMCSTAIVSKMLAERMELGTPHGRDVMGILLFQDLAVVAFLILIPSLGKPGERPRDGARHRGGQGGGRADASSCSSARSRCARGSTLVARQRSSELFVLNVLLVTLGLGALTESLGLSLALGAFLAGMLIAETEYRYQVEEDIKPFRDVLLGLFFVTVGMVLDLAGRRARTSAGSLLLLVVPVLAKFALIVAAGARVRRRRCRRRCAPASTSRRPASSRW